jgi:hypothetical protein
MPGIGQRNRIVESAQPVGMDVSQLLASLRSTSP